MATFTYPGVYIEEIPSGQQTITGVATSIAAFVGWSNQGPVGQPTMVESWAEYQATFGGMIPGIYLGYAVYQFFQNGGSDAWVVGLQATEFLDVNGKPVAAGQGNATLSPAAAAPTSSSWAGTRPPIASTTGSRWRARSARSSASRSAAASGRTRYATSRGPITARRPPAPRARKSPTVT